MLNNELIVMGACCEDAIAAAEQLIVNYDEKLAKTAKELEVKIDSQERSIEMLCTDMLLRQQPVASDFRLISAAIHMISDMERIGDMARDISEISKLLVPSGIVKSVTVSQMAAAAKKMVSESVDSFVKRDKLLAQRVIDSDDVVDDLFVKVRNEVVDVIAADRSAGETCIDIIMIAKYFERIGDHASNIAERVITAVK